MLKIGRILATVLSTVAILGTAQNRAHALIFNFSFPNSTGTEAGTLNGTLVVPDTGGTNTAGASSLTISSAPGALSVFNGLEFIGNSGYGVQVNSFTYTSSSVSIADFVVASTTASFGSNFLALRLRVGDPASPINSFGASTTNDQATIATGLSFVAPFVRNPNTAQLTFVPVAVPFDIPGGATIPAVGGLLALGLMRKARKSLASNTRISKPINEMVS